MNSCLPERIETTSAVISEVKSSLTIVEAWKRAGSDGALDWIEDAMKSLGLVGRSIPAWPWPVVGILLAAAAMPGPILGQSPTVDRTPPIAESSKGQSNSAPSQSSSTVSSFIERYVRESGRDVPPAASPSLPTDPSLGRSSSIATRPPVEMSSLPLFQNPATTLPPIPGEPSPDPVDPPRASGRNPWPSTCR